MTDTFPRYMMATKAVSGGSKPMDISSDEPDICIVHKLDLDGDNYVGNWVYGFGFAGVSFPVATTRELTEAEYDKYDGTGWGIGNTYYGNLEVRKTNGVVVS